MDLKNKAPIALFLILYINHISGTAVPAPKKLEVHIYEGEVIVLWEHPEEAPSEAVYNVQMTKYGSGAGWDNVSNCWGITKNYCLIDPQIYEYTDAYIVRVQLVKGDQKSAWKRTTRFYVNQGDLLPPSFTLRATSSTLAVYVHEKPILRKIYPYGVAYTLYLEEIGQENKTTTVYVRDDEGEDQRTKTFTSLHWGRKYCVSVKVEGLGSLSTSNVSEKQCLHLPEQEFYIIAATSLSILGILVFVAFLTGILLCYIKRPAKTPVALKSPVRGWHPLSVSEGTMEVITDKGWFLSSTRTDTKTTLKLPETNVTIIDEEEEENRRTSLDSGVSVEADSAADNRGQAPARQEDSGCGSMGGSDSSADSHTDYPLQDDSMEAEDVRKREDSGMGLSCQLHSSSLNLDDHDTEPLVETVIVGNYRTQSPSNMQIQKNNSEDMLKQIPAHSLMAEVVTGYKAGPQSCICSETGQCSWCHRHGNHGPEGAKVYRTVWMENLHNNTHMDSISVNSEASFLQLTETFPLLTSKYEQDSNMNNVALSLCDVQLTTD
ncbi:interleukin-10 receptor subunit alpha [Fundulus heteroclitus]|uniref:interleukin-10 receptor subunit alpha n=1 Tax=Fundulus heteroclitus TaxID=8078 RepID=UPI00165C9D51|nr:interleukin-10 receptor subunit alpha [Fundulus heteroclitus]